MTNQRNSVILILSITLLNIMGVSIIIPILPLLADIFTLSPSELSLVIACFSLPSAFFTPISGLLADQYGRKNILLAGLILFIIGGVGCGLSSSFSQLLMFRAIQGLGSAPLGILYGTLIGDIYPEEERPKMMGMAGATVSIGVTIYPAIGGFLGNIHWTLPFWVSLLALPICILALQFSYQKIDTHSHIKTYFTTSKKFIFNPHALGLFSLTFLGFSILYGPILTYFPLLANTLYNASPAQIGMVFSLSSLGTTIIAMGLMKLSKIYTHRNLLLTSALFFLVSQLLIAILPLKSSILWVLCIPIFINGVAQGLTFPLISSYVSSLAPISNRAMVMASNGTVMRISQTISPLFFSLGWTLFNWQGPFILGIVVSLFFGVVVTYVFPNLKTPITKPLPNN